MRRRAPRTPRLVTEPKLLRLARKFIQRFLSLRIFGSLVGHQMLEQDAPARSDWQRQSRLEGLRG